MTMKSQPKYPFQQRVIDFGSTRDRIGYLCFYGAGKSFMFLRWLHDRTAAGEKMFPVLMLGSKNNLGNWEDQIATHSDLTFSTVLGDAEERKKAFAKPAHIYLCTYDIFSKRKMKKKMPDGTTVKFTQKSSLHNEAAHMTFQTIAADESKMLSKMKTERYKAIEEYFGDVRHRAILVGRMVTEEAEEIFGQMSFLDRGYTFGRSYWKFKSNYFMPGPAWRPYEWALKPGAGEMIAKRLSYSCITVTKDEIAKELPPKVYIRKYVDLPEDTVAMCKSLKKEFECTLPNKSLEFQTKWAVVRSAKMHQLCQGFIYLKESNTNEETQVTTEETTYHLVHDAKLKWVEENLELLLQTGPTLIWTHFKPVELMLAATLDKLKLKYGMFTSSLPLKVNDEAVNSFQRGTFDVLVIGQGVGYQGLNLQRACNALYFDNSYRAEFRLNSEDRCHRIGSDAYGYKSITYYDLVARGGKFKTIDDVVLDAHMAKADVSEAIFKYMTHKDEEYF